MKNKSIITIFVILLAGIIGLVYFSQPNLPLGKAIPDNLKLKAPKEKIIRSQEITQQVCGVSSSTPCAEKKIVKYDYVSDIEVPPATIKIGKNTITEDIEKRTPSSQTFKLSGSDSDGEYQTKFFSNNAFYRQSGKWYGVETATTTQEAFAEQTVLFGASGDPIYPDPGTAGPTGDGFFTNYVAAGEAFQTLLARTDNVNQTEAADDIVRWVTHASTANKWTVTVKAGYTFDTNIGAGATISSVTLGVYGSSKADLLSDAPNINVYGWTPSVNFNFVAADQGQMKTTAFATAIAYADFSITGYNTFTLNATGIDAIDKTGITGISIRNANFDIAGGAPTGTVDKDTFFRGHYADYAGTDRDPYLTITYTVVSAPPSQESDIIIFE